MNEITAAIRKKAEEYRAINSKFVPDNQSEIMLEKAYTSGCEELVATMLKFTEWAYGKAVLLGKDRWLYDWENSLGVEITTEQLLLKFLESEQEK